MNSDGPKDIMVSHLNAMVDLDVRTYRLQPPFALFLVVVNL